MKTKYRLRKKTDFDGTWFYIERLQTNAVSGNPQWWPIASAPTEQGALKIFENVENVDKEEILREKEV